MLKHEVFLFIASLFIFSLMIPACRAGKPSFKELKVETPDVTLYARMAGNPGPGQVAHRHQWRSRLVQSLYA